MSIFYLIFIMLTAYFSFRYDGIEEYDSHKQHRFWLMCIYLICLTGFSYGIGGDKFVYMREFEEYPDTFTDVGDYVWLQLMLKGQMPLWTLLNLISRSVFHSFYALQLIQSAAINSAVCYVASKYTHRYFLFLLLYVFTLQYFIFNTEIMREGIALSFVLIGMEGWMSGKKWLYFVMLPIGLMFHVSALTALIFPIAQYLKASWKLLVIGILSSFAVWVLSDLLLGSVMMAVLGGMGAMVQKVLFYSLQASSIFGFLRSAITFLILPFIIMYSVMLNEKDEDKRRRMEHMIGYMVLLGILACSFAGFIRLYNYIRIYYLVLMATFVYELFWEKKHLIIRCTTLLVTSFLFLLQYFIHYETTNTYYYNFFYPYTCILDEDSSVFFREVAHEEAVDAQESDNNVREIN
jgi:hypothetical protein